MEPEHNKERIPRWLNRYNKESHLMNLSNYEIDRYSRNEFDK